MAEEFKAKTYYKELDEGNKWVDVHKQVCIGIEKFFAKLIFKDDLSRIMYATPEMAFRHRVEQMDSLKGKEKGIQYNPISLGLPFMVYYQSGEVEADDRPAAMQANQSLIGEYSIEAGQRLRSTAYQCEYEATLFFARRDETRLAQQLLFWETEPKHPIFLVAKVQWRNATLNVPVFITIESIENNAQYKESDWLSQTRIFPMKVKMMVRSYQVLVNCIDHIYTLPIRYGNKHSPGTLDPCVDAIYLVEEAILIWANEKWGFNNEKPPIIRPNDPDIGVIVDNYFQKENYTEEELEELVGKIPNYVTNEIIKGYFTHSPEIRFDHFCFDVSKSTSNSLTLDYKINDEDQQFFGELTIYIPGHEEIKINDPRVTTIEIKNLESNSEYSVKMIAMSITGARTLVTLRGQTLDGPENFAPQPHDINRRLKRKKGNSLIGMEF